MVTAILLASYPHDPYGARVEKDLRENSDFAPLHHAETNAVLVKLFRKERILAQCQEAGRRGGRNDSNLANVGSG